MAAPAPFALTDTAQHLTTASAVINNMAAAPVALGGPPQWALDQHNVLRHDLFWNNQIMRVMQYNTQLIILEQQVHSFLGGSSGSELQPLPMPPALIAVPVAPAPPAPGAPLVLPAPFVALEIALRPPHVLFPANKRSVVSPRTMNPYLLLQQREERLWQL
ncbi:hypothetical protein B0H13DRAFT_1931715 [Mycena leptocephala]|nr:hypothetical protein B0H13DRAFT_1931715 [Mycena leptocephala]